MAESYRIKTELGVNKNINVQIDQELKAYKGKYPPKILVLIFTDGQENDSHQYDAEAIEHMIKAREEEQFKRDQVLIR